MAQPNSPDMPPERTKKVRLGVNSVSPRMNTIASRDQFKPIKIGENLLVNYNLR